MTKLKEDIETTRRLFSTFSGNPLAVRALEVIERVLPNPPTLSESPSNQQFDEVAIDLSLWPLESSDPFSAFGWPDFGWAS